MEGLQDCYKKMTEDVQEKYGIPVKKLAALGISAMMHGYMPFDKSGELLVPFRTWRNTITGEAATELTELFNFNIPQRWSIAHLYQAILNKEDHVNNIAYLSTLEGYIHWQLSGEKVIGIGEASGMFPIDSKAKTYNAHMLDKFASIDAVKQYSWNIREILPTIKVAGEVAGYLTEEGAKRLDITGNLEAGCPMAPPEGDAGMELYKKYPEIGGVVHTHSPEAVAWAQAGRDIPLYGTTHADYFFGPIPCARNLTQEEIDAGYEMNTGKVIIETFEEKGINPTYTPAVLCKNHGPFTWGKDAKEAVHNAVVLEEVAKMAFKTELLNQNVKPAPNSIKNKHFYRKHGENAYYGQD